MDQNKQIALAEIKKVILNKSTSLKLIDLGLNEIPKEILDAKHITTLYIKNSKVENLEILENLTNLTYLNLKGNNIKSLASLASLRQLSKLALSNNNINDLSPLSNLTNLTMLTVGNNKINDLKPISNLLYLDKLGISSNYIEDLNPLSKLTNLMQLSLMQNRVRDISALANLTNLTRLTIAKNKIHDLNSLSKLKNLTNLIAEYNNLTNDSLKSLSEVKSLSSLNLRGNKLDSIDSLSEYDQLLNLNLRDNNIKDLTPLMKLKNLTSLNLQNNFIRDIAPLAELTNLKSINLISNQITDISDISHFINLNIRINTSDHFKTNEIGIMDNPITTPPLSVIELGNKAIIKYLNDIESQGTEKLNEGKIIIVGEPEAGKSTLMDSLIDPDYQLQKKDSTVGIDVKSYSFTHPKSAERILKANIWDFGGQEIQYMTHQFFLTPDSIYILVVTNDRKGSTNFPYWFKIIHLLGERKGCFSPILVVKNRNSKNNYHFDFDEAYYRKRYPELEIVVHEVDLNNRKSDFNAMREKLEELFCDISLINENRPAYWHSIHSDLIEEQKTQNYISFNTYSKICEKHNIYDEESQILLSTYLHYTGSLLHFAQDVVLRDFIILNPQWAVDAVYSVISDPSIEQKNGRFSQKQLDKIWNDYTIPERANLLNLMKKDNFEICYQLNDNEDTFIASQLLEQTSPQYSFNSEKSLKFHFRYKFMPNGIISRLIVRQNHLINNGLVWQKGVVLIDENCRAEILEEDTKEGHKAIEITIIGDEQKRKYLLYKIREEIKHIHIKWFKNIEFDEMVPCNCSDCQNNPNPKFFDFKTLTRYQENNKPTIECTESMQNVNLRTLMDGIFLPNELVQKNEGIDEDNGIDFKELHIHHHAAPTIEKEDIDKVNDIKSLTPWYKEWWFFGILSAILSFIIIYFWIDFSIMISSISGILIGYAVYSFNPKQRYWRGVLLGFSWLTFKTSPLITINLGWINKETLAFFETGAPLDNVIALGVIGLIGYWSYLDHKIRKD